MGVDLLGEEGAELERRGYNAVCADVESMDLGERFDVIVAGDIIEHLSDLGAFFTRVKAHLREGGVLLVATPNPVTMIRFVRLSISGRVRANGQHTCWFTASVLKQLAERQGFEATDESYADDTRYYYRLWPRLAPRGGTGRMAWRRARTFIRHLLWQPGIWINSLLCLIRPRMAETLCMAMTLRRSVQQTGDD